MSTSVFSYVVYGVVCNYEKQVKEIKKFCEDTGKPYYKKVDVKILRTASGVNLDDNKDFYELYNDEIIYRTWEKSKDCVFGIQVLCNDVYDYKMSEIKLTKEVEDKCEKLFKDFKITEKPKLYNLLNVD